MLPSSESTLTVLLVDDEPHILFVLQHALVKCGMAVLTAGDGEQAFEIAMEECPNLIITDYQMPFVDGMTFCRKLQAESTTRDIPVFMLTGRGFTVDPAELKQTNIKALFSKPFSPTEILAKIQSEIGSGSHCA